jgi:hypothetical protein
LQAPGKASAGKAAIQRTTMRDENMNITIEKLLHGIGFIIRAVFLIAWNLGKMGFALFLVFLGMLMDAPGPVPYQTSYWNYRRHWDDYC